MVARFPHKRGETLRWACQRTTDPKPGSGVEPAPISLTDVSVRVALRNDEKGFYQPLTVQFEGPVPRENGEFIVYFAGQDQADWPLGDCFFDFVFSNASANVGEEDDVAKTETAVVHIQKEQTKWP